MFILFYFFGKAVVYLSYLLDFFHCYRYRKKVALYNERVEELNTITQRRDDVKKQYDDWRKKRHVYGFVFHKFHVNLFHTSSLTEYALLQWQTR